MPVKPAYNLPNQAYTENGYNFTRVFADVSLDVIVWFIQQTKFPRINFAC